MANRIFVSAVVILWLSSMSWLVVDRILPSFYSGQPPLVEAYETGEVVAWRVNWGGVPVGWAASVRVASIAGTAELHNRIALKNAPLMELAPAWMRHAVGDVGNMTLDIRTRIEFDSLGNFSAFDSRISINDMPSVLSIFGRIEDSNLELQIRTDKISYPTSVYLPDRKALNEALFPGARLPHMYVGRRWREEVYSPFHAPSDPVEVLQAEVVSTASMEYQGEIVKVMCVEYRSAAGSGVPKDARLQAVSWVEQDGNILRHDVYIGRSKMRFERLTRDDADEIGKKFFERLVWQDTTTSSLPGQKRLPKQGASKSTKGLPLLLLLR